MSEGKSEGVAAEIVPAIHTRFHGYSRLLTVFEPIGNRREEYGGAIGRLATARAGANESIQAPPGGVFFPRKWSRLHSTTARQGMAGAGSETVQPCRALSDHVKPSPTILEKKRWFAFEEGTPAWPPCMEVLPICSVELRFQVG